MTTARTARLAAASLAAAALVLAGCSTDDGADDAATTATETATSATTETATETETSAAAEEGVKDSDQKASLADWDGTWKSLGAYVDDPEMQDPMQDAADEHGESTDEIRAEIDESRGADFEGLVIEGDKIAFIADAADLDTADASEGVEYTFVGAKDVTTAEHEFTWFIFEGGEGAPHKYVLLMPLHGEESLAHFHMRYGDTIEEALDAPEGWFPTFVDPKEATDEQIAETLFHHDH